MSSSPVGSPGATGRPSMWTQSAQRKMTRLYVYTTLPLGKILELVYANASAKGGDAPGRESANKKLNALLDKQPRWLRARSDTDMGRRLTELSQSPTRLRTAESAAWALGHSRSTSGSSGQLAGCADADLSASPRTDSGRDGDGGRQQLADSSVFTTFLRRTSCLSCSTTADTADSYTRALEGFPRPYVQTVRRLVKRFTAPVRPPPPFDILQWQQDVPALSPTRVPGDFLHLDDAPQDHAACFCSHQDLDDCVLPWVTSAGVTQTGARLLTSGPRPDDADVIDTFGNTLLHFLAARGSLERLTDALKLAFCQPLAGRVNSAGQTFLHVLSPQITENTDYVSQLLAALAPLGHDLGARDIYGRTVFHVLQHHGHLTPDMIALCPDDRSLYARDAFGVTLSSLAPFTVPEAGLEHEAKLLELLRQAAASPLVEDAAGRNGLHCLAAAALNDGAAINKHTSHTPTLTPTTPTPTTPTPTAAAAAAAAASPRPRDTDSGSERMQFRLSLALGLLQYGVDPNQRDAGGSTPLMAFAASLREDNDYKSGSEILRRLVAAGADVNARNRTGETALHVAVRHGRKLAVKALVDAGASPHVRDAAGRSLLDLADDMTTHRCDSPADYAHYEACRAWLSGRACALQRPRVSDEWRLNHPPT